ncbi:Imm5 family immunity protein [Bacteroides eggerthii]|uniref:Imm5 family immunity protein n=1 Tax=Bacteroides eggerthii TaxID=28111 RepID=A0ABT7U6D7_9BACE|nr:Imm5 family immunity protein [Bacteroides eggerthii]
MIQQIEKLKEIINQNSMGHLPLPYRVDLMKQIGDTRTVQKVLCECCKKACSCFPEEFGAESLLYNILSEMDSYLYNNKGTAESILVSIERLRNYVEQSADCPEGMASWAIISLGYAIRYDAASILAIEDYNGEDDDAFDFESWNADFICSIACSGSNPFVETGNVEKRKEYWLWYVKMVLEVSQNPNLKYLSLPVFKSPTPLIDIPVRRQLDLVKTNKRISFDDIRDAILLQIPSGMKWDFIDVLFVSCTSSMLNIRFSTGDKIKIGTMTTNNICKDFRLKRKEMYMYYPKEGAWFSLKMVITSNNSYNLDFNYDNWDEIPSYFQELDWILSFYTKFPRSKEYTPLWLRKIVGRRKLYLT